MLFKLILNKSALTWVPLFRLLNQLKYIQQSLKPNLKMQTRYHSQKNNRCYKSHKIKDADIQMFDKINMNHQNEKVNKCMVNI